jgi:hypothetical protein
MVAARCFRRAIFFFDIYQLASIHERFHLQGMAQDAFFDASFGDPGAPQKLRRLEAVRESRRRAGEPPDTALSHAAWHD